MQRLILLACLAAAGAAVAAQGTFEPAQDSPRPGQDNSTPVQDSSVPVPDGPVLHSVSSELVVLPVVVTDEDGRLLSELSRDGFSVYDNDRLQPVAFFTADDSPVSVGLVIDDSGSMRHKIGEVVAAAGLFVRSSNPEDELFAIDFNDDVHDALGGRRLSAADEGPLVEALSHLVPQGRTALNDALLVALQRLEESALPRKVLILISDGGDNASAGKLSDVLARARASSVVIYTIGVFEAGDPDSNEGVLKQLASITGGARFLPRSPGLLLQACQQIAREIRSGYTIGFEPPERDGAFHRVRVQVSRGGRRIVRTRPGYMAALPEGGKCRTSQC